MNEVPATELAIKPTDNVLFLKDGLSNELRQGEVISNLIQYQYNSGTEEIEAYTHDFCIILSQDCDLLQDFNRIKTGSVGEINGVLIFQAFSAVEHKAKLGGSDIWKRVGQNKDERYHFIEQIPVEADLLGAGVPSLIVDFKRFFSISTGEIGRQLALVGGARRRSRMGDLYREHVQSRMSFYFQRVGLPRQHEYRAVTV